MHAVSTSEFDVLSHVCYAYRKGPTCVFMRDSSFMPRTLSVRINATLSMLRSRALVLYLLLAHPASLL